MKKFEKDITKALAQQANGLGGISEAQHAFEQIAWKLATWVATGMSMQSSGEYDDIFEALEGDVRTAHIIGRVQQALLENDGVAVGGLFRALFPNIGVGAPKE
jgi:hypothetical protein